MQGSFFTQWEDGPPRGSPALGDGFAPGMLAELVVLPESGVVPMAESLDYRAGRLPAVRRASPRGTRSTKGRARWFRA